MTRGFPVFSRSRRYYRWANEALEANSDVALVYGVDSDGNEINQTRVKVTC